jgi:hypothetical protein
MSYFVDDFDPNDKRAVLEWSAYDHDPGDPWGWAMSWLFDIASELYNRGAEVPAELQFRPSPTKTQEVSEDRAPGMAEIGTEALIYAARVFHRYDNRCRRAGLDY